jgi:PTS system sucrose-specific IIC component
MDYAACAKAILQEIGGRENLVSAAHCATRLRLVVADKQVRTQSGWRISRASRASLPLAGQLQIIIGTGTVNKVYRRVHRGGGHRGRHQGGRQEGGRQQIALVQARMIKTLGDVFVPIIPAIVASGLLMGLLEGIANVFPAITSNGTYTIIHLFSNAAFVFLPVSSPPARPRCSAATSSSARLSA